jgi:hypothetical protein
MASEEDLRDQHVGEIEVGIDIRYCRSSPSVRVAIPMTNGDFDPSVHDVVDAALTELNAMLRGTFAAWLRANSATVLSEGLGDGWEVEKKYQKPILDAEWRKQEFQKLFSGKGKLAEALREADVVRQKAIDEDVEGIRHSGLVWASSAQEAVDLADESGQVAKSWESPRASYRGSTIVGMPGHGEE